MAIDTGKRIAVLGAGASGIAAARLAIAGGAAWVGVFDSGDPEKLAAADSTLRDAGAETCFGEAALQPPAALDLVVISPGIDANWPIGRAFSGTGTPLIGEIEFAYERCGKPVVAITGTNGKTTTTELTAAVLNAGGQRSVAAGNVGTAFCDIVRSGEDYDVITLEVSSFQLETITAFRPEVAVWMNFAADHMDRYESIEDYRQAKLRIFENQTAEDFAVINAAEPPGELAARTLGFSAFAAEADFTLKSGRIRFRGEEILDFRLAALHGRHNAENVMAAMAVAHARGISFEAMTETVLAFTAPRHRCEPVGVVKGVTYINDSKATNLHALASALRGQEEPVVLIAGGKDKGLDYGELRDAVAGSVSGVIAIGEMAESICEAWGDRVACETASTLPAAVELAAGQAKPGQVVLFAPGTSSFDMFSSYGERGDAFRDAVQQLPS